MAAVLWLSLFGASTAARADGYIVEDGGLQASEGAYDQGGESVLVPPRESGSFESLLEPGADAGEGWFLPNCTQCDGYGCDACAGSGYGCDDCPPSGCGHGPCGDACPRWVVQIDALMLWQGNIQSQPLLQNAGGFTVLDANDAQTPMSAGPRVGLFYNLNQCYAIEGNYFNVRPFDGNAFLPMGSYTPVGLAGFVPPNPSTAAVYTSGAIQSAELNLRKRVCGCPLTWLTGFRWVELNQSLSLVSNSSTIAPTGVDSVTGNDLYGGQVGADLGLWNAGGPFTANLIGKSGIFWNQAYQRTSGTFDAGGVPTPQGPVGAAAQQTAFFGELGINGSLRLTNWLSWRLGYSFFWLSGVAVPASQLALTNFSPAPGTALINTNGSVFLHGVTTGLEARW